jgi:hypothetical protein
VKSEWDSHESGGGKCRWEKGLAVSPMNTVLASVVSLGVAGGIGGEAAEDAFGYCVWGVNREAELSAHGSNEWLVSERPDLEVEDQGVSAGLATFSGRAPTHHSLKSQLEMTREPSVCQRVMAPSAGS